MDLQLTNKKALVTGSTAGIGFAIASLLAQEGAAVVVNGRSQPKVEEAIQRIKRACKDTQVTGVAADLGTKEGVAMLTGQLRSVDILVNNLGIFEPKPFAEISDEDWLRFFEVNVLSGVRLSRFYLHAPEELGADHLHLQRVRREHPGGDDPLRRHQDGADRPGPWPSRNDGRDKRDG
jgi:NAD(P)-dependent dehydrogenase (short-subunit alcohol dehydrogenase family)